MLSSYQQCWGVPGVVRIRVHGCLDQRSAARWAGLAVGHEEQVDGTTITTLTGEIADECTLLTVLNTLYDLGFALLSVSRLPAA